MTKRSIFSKQRIKTSEFVVMNKRDNLLAIANGQGNAEYVPAAFFMHFERAYHQGQAAIDKHVEFFRFTDMDLVKVQYEQIPPPSDPIRNPQDWENAPRYSQEFFEPTIAVVEGLVRALKNEALVILTIYSPFMWAVHLTDDTTFDEHLREYPDKVKQGMEIMTENVVNLVRGCIGAGVDGFYVSTQGGEAHRYGGTDAFLQIIKPTDLAAWDETRSCEFNILHVCDYEGGYDDLTPFLDYPGQVINSSLQVGDRTYAPAEIVSMFKRPFMGGLERKGVIARGSLEEIQREVNRILEQASEGFILAADCTVPSDTPWENLKIAIETAHQFRS
jgi:uroporphyrinogen decarboxylase